MPRTTPPAEDPTPPETAVDWRKKSMTELMNHIVRHHHAYTRTQLAFLRGLSSQVAQAHGTKYPELFSLDNLIHDMGMEMEDHMRKEEEVVFSYLKAMEEALAKGKKPPNPFSKVPFEEHPISALLWEHGMIGEEWEDIHRLTHDYTPPPDSSEVFQALYRGLRELEEDLHQHVQLENGVLFSRAMEMGWLD